MTIEVMMPKLSPTMEEGSLAKWLVKAGDRVEAGDILAEIETDKATMELEATEDGLIAEILVEAGTEGVKVGLPIARIAPDGDSPSPPSPSLAPPTPAPSNPVAVSQDAAVPAPAPVPIRIPAPSDSAVGDRIKASPLARRLASERGVSLADVTATGPGGRIVRDDIELATKVAEAAPTSLPPLTPSAPDVDIPHERISLSGMRKTIARRLTEAKSTIPHIYLTIDVRLDALLALRAELNAALAPQGAKLSLNDLLIKALGLALMRNPDCNVRFADDALIRFKRADIAVAVAVPGGLITPVVVGADSKTVSAISAEMRELAEAARAGTLAPEAWRDGTASISNLGMHGIQQFDAVINPPQAMILAVGTAEERVIAVGGAPAVATLITLTGSFDHRAIDGADAAVLMSTLRELLEKPLRLVA